MSISSLLASSDTQPASPTARRESAKPSSIPAPQINGSPHNPLIPSSFDRKPSVHSRQPSSDTVNYLTTPVVPPLVTQQAKEIDTPAMDVAKINGEPQPPRAPSPTQEPKAKIVINEKDLQAALAKIDATDFSDVDAAGFEEARQRFTTGSTKRKRQVEEKEHTARKVYRSRRCPTNAI